MKPLLITAAITGGGPPKGKSPAQPASPAEIVADAVACWRAGAAMIHLHARTESGETTSDPAAYRRLCNGIRAAGCDAVLNISAGDDGGRAGHAQRLAVADGGAEVVSLDAGSFNLGSRLYDNNPRYLRAMATRLREAGLKPEIEIFDAGHLAAVAGLVEAGLIRPPHFVQFVTGPAGTMPADIRLLDLLVEGLPPGSEWGVSAQTGDDHAAHVRLLLWAFGRGGHVRTGLEDMVWLRAGEPARSNADLVEQWIMTARIWGRPIASPAEARAMLGLPAAADPDRLNDKTTPLEDTHETLV